MEGRIKLPNCRDRSLIGCTHYDILSENDAFKTMNMTTNLKGKERRKFMLKWMNQECDKAKRNFVDHLIALHSEVDYYGQDNQYGHITKLQNDTYHHLNISQDKNIAYRTYSMGYDCIHSQSVFKSKSYRYHPY